MYLRVVCCGICPLLYRSADIHVVAIAITAGNCFLKPVLHALSSFVCWK